MEKQYVVKLDRCDGKDPEIVCDPTSLRACVCFVQGWWGGVKDGEVILVPELFLWRIYIEEVQA